MTLCKNCKWWEDEAKCENKEVLKLIIGDLWSYDPLFYTPPEFGCIYGEEKDNNKNKVP